MEAKKLKRAQEEIVGFAIIVIIVSIILVFFLVFSLTSNKSEISNSYEASSFLQSALHYTSTCEQSSKYLNIQDLLVSCYRKERCGDGSDSCEVLNQTLLEIMGSSWPVGPDNPVKGYKIEASSSESSGNKILVSISAGNMTSSYKSSQQIIPKPDTQITASFTAYY